MTSFVVKQFVDEAIKHRIKPGDVSYIHVGPIDPGFFSPDVFGDKLKTAVLLEPLPEYFAQASAALASATVLRFTLAHENGGQTIYRFRPSAAAAGRIPPEALPLRSFSLDTLIARGARLGARLPADRREVLRDLVDRVSAGCLLLSTLVTRHGLGRPDLLVVRTPGAELETLAGVVFNTLPVGAVLVDARQLEADEAEQVRALLSEGGYMALHLGEAVVGLRPERKRGLAQASSAIAAARRLLAAGEAASANVLLDSLGTLDLDGPQLVERADALREAGRIPEALADLISARGDAPVDDAYRRCAVGVFNGAVLAFNAAQAAQQADEASRLISLLAEFNSNDEQINRQAMLATRHAGLAALAARFAERIPEDDTLSGATALDTLADYARNIGDRQNVRALRTRLALRQDPGFGGLLKLKNLHDLAGSVLCDPLGEDDLRLLEYCRAQADTIPATTGERLEGFYVHYRLLLQSVRFDVPVNGRVPLPPFTDAGGEEMSFDALRRRLDENNVRAVLVVAGDMGYVRRYAKLFACSALMNADVPVLVLVHVIGGAGQMKQIAGELNIDSPLLVYSYDEFDEKALATQCFAAPQGLYEKPVAHYQCIRFAVADSLLHEVGRPIFVSDIDSIVEHGLKDILDRNAGNDVVLNVNRSSLHFGSRITANLLLYYPTEVAKRFSGFLNAYLTRQLAQPMVTRWIDQVGLLLAWQSVMMATSDAKLMGFEEYDINNLMFTDYQKTPFAFLSLFAGFQMDSLPKRYRALV